MGGEPTHIPKWSMSISPPWVAFWSKYWPLFVQDWSWKLASTSAVKESLSLEGVVQRHVNVGVLRLVVERVLDLDLDVPVRGVVVERVVEGGVDGGVAPETSPTFTLVVELSMLTSRLSRDRAVAEGDARVLAEHLVDVSRRCPTRSRPIRRRSRWPG